MCHAPRVLICPTHPPSPPYALPQTPSLQICRIYDLKGSERNRFNAEAAAKPQDSSEVHLDDNLRRANLQAREGCRLPFEGLVRTSARAHSSGKSASVCIICSCCC